MKKVFYIIVIPLLLIVSLQTYAQSNKGTEFWTAFMCHNNNTSDLFAGRAANMVLYITSDLSTKGSVEVGGVRLSDFTVTANQVTFVDIPMSAHMATQGLFAQSGIHITSERPIAIYAHIYASNVSGATLLLPVSAMGKEYMSLNYTQKSNADQTRNPDYSTFAVIGTEDNTTVSITPTVPLVDGQAAGVPFTITLNKGQVYQGLARTDLTGTKIQSVSNSSGGCKKIAVFSGSSRMGIGCAAGQSLSSDNLFQQVYPTATWGKNYIAAPLASRPYDVYRIVLSEPNTTVSLNGATISSSQFTQGLYYEFSSRETNVISADKPIQVVQYSATQNQTIDCSRSVGDVGDPEMIYLSPIEQGLNRVTLYSTSRFDITRSYINVIIPTSAASTLTVDGAPFNGFKAVPANPAYSYAQIQVFDGSHTLNAAVPFNAIAYGFGSTESYGYAAGTNLQDLNTIIGLQNPDDIYVPLTNGCSDKTYRLQVTIPYQTNSIVWKIDGEVKQTQTNPVAARTAVRDGERIYIYEYPVLLNLTAGTHLAVATVYNPNGDVCGLYSDIENVFSITDPPGKEFAVAPSNCLGDETAFKDNTSTSTSNVIKSWLWDFGDGATSTEQNPAHKYAATGNYDVRLTVVDYSGCTTVSNVKTVHIIPRPIANFTISTPDCIGRLVTFTSTSTAVEPGAAITKWEWDFGDGVTSTQQNPIHRFLQVKTYDVKLTVTTATGCVSDAKTIPVTINPLPVADFILPDVCISDRNSPFTSTSTIADGTEAEFQYLWDFGDRNSSAVNNTSTLKNATHSYTATGDYTVRLTVKSKYGCDSTITKSFTVNGANPTPAFTVQNESALCSGDSVAFVDRSSVSPGNITKLEWVFDSGNSNVRVTIDRDHLRSDRTYRHFYGLNNTTVPRQYRVVLYAYSGESCVNYTQPYIITVNPNPLVVIKLKDSEVALPANYSLCQMDPAVDLEADSNVPGTAQFTGIGINASGRFDPKVAGPGRHTITMVFTANGSLCTYSTTFSIVVNPNPEVSLLTKYSVLEGSQITLRPDISLLGGGALTYEWTPAAGLSQSNIANPVVTIRDDATYTLKITATATGCATTVTTNVKVLKIPLVPNAFTPNGDGINDIWEIKYLNDYPNATVEIFGRSGNRVFYSNGYGKAWDGRLNGGDLPAGTYYYIISPNSGRKPTSGYLTIIR